MLRKSVFIMMMGILLCALLTSCGKLKTVFNAASSLQSEERPEIAEKSTKQPAVTPEQKYAAYTNLDMFLTGKLQESLDAYTAKFGEADVFKVKKNDNLYMGILVDTMNKKELDESFDYASRQPAMDEVDQTVKELNPKFKALIATLEEANTYYKLKSYVDDDFVKGRILHQTIHEQTAQMKPQLDQFITAFEAKRAQKLQGDLDSFKQKDYMIRLYALSFMLKAGEIQDELNRQGITSNNMKALNEGPIKDKYSLLVADMNQFLEYVKDTERIKKEGLNTNFTPVEVYKSRIIQLKASATDLLARAEEARNDLSSSKSKFTKQNKDGTPENYSKKLKEAWSDYMKIK